MTEADRIIPVQSNPIECCYMPYETYTTTNKVEKINRIVTDKRQNLEETIVSSIN